MSGFNFRIDEGQRQLTVRALAVQSLVNPGFVHADREIAEILFAGDMFDEFRRLLDDIVKPVIQS